MLFLIPEFLFVCRSVSNVTALIGCCLDVKCSVLTISKVDLGDLTKLGLILKKN